MLLLTLVVPLLQAGTSCGDFLLGGACKPAEYTTLVDNTTAEACKSACASINEDGCCWHHPDTGSCQFASGAVAYEYGEASVRSAGNCSGSALEPPTPQQLHIAFGASADEMLVQWAVKEHPLVSKSDAILRFGLSGEPRSKWVSMPPFYESTGPGKYRQYRVLLKNLTAGKKYEYSVGWQSHTTPEVSSHFTVARRGDISFAPRIAMFGDIGWADNQILPLLQEESDVGAVDAIVIYGDFVYWDNGENENAFMRDMSRMSGNGSIPVMTTPGNGDWTDGKYPRYSAQFGMPGWEETESAYHSFDIGRVHIAGIDTELIEHDYDNRTYAMLAWLEEDMKKANARRAEVPWIVVHFHRPAYSTGGHDSVPYEVFEPLMYKYGVDLVFSGHVHNQERTLPVYNKTVHAGPDPAHPYADAKAPVYVVSGNPGNSEETDFFTKGFDEWTVWRSNHFGYAHMTVYNESVLEVDFVATGQAGAVTDRFQLTKTTTCNFGGLCTPEPPVHAKDVTPTPSSIAAAALQQTWQRRRGSTTPIPPAQLDALIELYNVTNGANWTRKANWLNGGNPCSPDAPWYGISCVNTTERTLPHLATSYGVTVVQLPSNNLQGSIPESLGTALAPTIQLIDLSHNLLQGAIPQTLLRGLGVLHTLFVEPKIDEPQYRLTGSLPSDMGLSTGLPNLRFLGLNRNALTGEVPASWGNLLCHERFASGNPYQKDPTLGGEVGCILWVMENNLTGSVPDALCHATYSEMYFSGNPMQCPHNSPPCVTVGYSNFPDGCSGKCTPCK